MKKLWLNSVKEHRVEINNDELVQSLGVKLRQMEKRVRRRDRREIFICVCMIPIFVWWTITVPQVAGKIGCVIIVATCVLVIYKLVRAKKINVKEDAALDIGRSLAVSLELLKRQIKLLQTILWWYLFPFFVGVTLFYFASATGIASKVIYTIIVIALCGYIYYLNISAVKKHLKPLQERLTKILNELSTSESN